MRDLAFDSWQAFLSALLGLAIVSFVGVGIRLVLLQTVQQRRERENRQINERLRTLIAAYKTLGGSFTGNLLVDPRHLADAHPLEESGALLSGATPSERARRVRDAVEGALSDVVLLGTEEQVRLAAHAASELASGRAVETAALVVSLRNFIREALDLDPVPQGLPIPRQGPARPGSGKAKEGGDKGEAGGKGGGGAGGAMAGAGGGLGLGVGLGVGAGHLDDRED